MAFKTLKYKRPESYFQYLYHYSFFLILFIFFLVVFFILIYKIVFGDTRLIVIIGTFISGIASIVVILGYSLRYLTSLNIVKLNPKSLQIPSSGYHGFFYSDLQSEGYYIDSKRKVLIITSSYKNIDKIYKVEKKSEKELIKNSYLKYNIFFPLELKGSKITIAELPVIYKDLMEKREYYINLIKNAVMYNYSKNPEKSVAIQFKSLPNFIPDFIKDDKNSDFVKFYKNFMPSLEKPIIYVSLKEPDKFIEELNLRIKRRGPKTK